MTREEALAKGTWYGDVFRWDSNGAVPFEDVLEKVCDTPEQMAACVRAREEDVARHVEEYRRGRALLAEDQEWLHEHIADLRSAYGPGEVVVDVITGVRYRT